MERYDKLLYVGTDEELADLLESMLAGQNCNIDRLCDSSQVIKRLQERLSWQDVTENPTLLTQRFENQYVAVLLDDDSFTSSGASLLRKIKAQYGGISVIVLTTETTLLSVCLAYLDMAEFLCFKPLEDYQPLLDAIGRAQRKHQCWKKVLRRLDASVPQSV